ncbi:hypothetical protein OZY43_07380 [Lactobacillus sp. ESL0785]|uniref:hypothetical protein n=1 Tax=Lactobacillus sp. ESL0785 TaxID=2983232 RepID=UPI0023F636F3|nr:hypothetical protein [Lactobacillus sp. ESL0785]WEV70748.1 hypothetical protein OZY43_07380 [Lactobacillus sp. ESL0785]
MKFKKIILGLSLVAALIAGGCSKQKKQSQPILTKTQVVQKAEKSFKSGQAKQIVTLGTDTAKQNVMTTATFGGNPTVFHLNYQTEAKGKTQNSEQWADNSGRLYLNGQSSWYQVDIEKLTGHTYADLLDSFMNNKMLMDPPAALTKAYKMSRNGNTYTLTATIDDKKVMQEAVDPVFTTNTQSDQQLKVYHKLEKASKFQNMKVKLVVKNGKMSSFRYLVNMQIGKLMKLNVGQSYGNMGSQDFLKLPSSALNAKPLPKTTKK